MLRRLFRELGGAGFVSEKVSINNILQGYDLVELGTCRRVPFIRFREIVPEEWDEAFSYGPFSFSQEGLDFGTNIIEKALREGISPIYIDEIGPVELMGLGFAVPFEKALEAGVDLVIVCRESMLDAVIQHFAIREWRLLER